MAKTLSRTPTGKAVWPRLTGTPDFKYDKQGVYKVKLVLTAEEGGPIVTKIKEGMKAALVDAKKKYAEAKAAHAALSQKERAGKKPPKEPELVDAPFFVDEETGDVTLSFKMYASGENKKTKEKFTQKPVIFDASGKVVTNDPKIGGGSRLKVSYELNQFATALGAGVSLRLKAVQIIELVEFGANAEYYGFEAEDGFTTDNTTAAPAETDVSSDYTDDDAAAAAGSESDDF
jgi:hypothetical protein